MKTYQLHTSILRSPEISRDLEVPGTLSLYKLAGAILSAYGFDFDHCFGFFSNVDFDSPHRSKKQYELFRDLIDEGEDLEPVESQSVKKTAVADVWQTPGDLMMFYFDYGDDWRFSVTLLGFGVRDDQKKYPRVFNKHGPAPKQYP